MRTHFSKMNMMTSLLMLTLSLNWWRARASLAAAVEAGCQLGQQQQQQQSALKMCEKEKECLGAIDHC
jgi:hypothetical protein